MSNLLRDDSGDSSTSTVVPDRGTLMEPKTMVPYQPSPLSKVTIDPTKLLGNLIFLPYRHLLRHLLRLIDDCLQEGARSVSFSRALSKAR